MTSHESRKKLFFCKRPGHLRKTFKRYSELPKRCKNFFIFSTVFAFKFFLKCDLGASANKRLQKACCGDCCRKSKNLFFYTLFDNVKSFCGSKTYSMLRHFSHFAHRFRRKDSCGRCVLKLPKALEFQAYCASKRVIIMYFFLYCEGKNFGQNEFSNSLITARFSDFLYFNAMRMMLSRFEKKIGQSIFALKLTHFYSSRN